jgi:DNA-binding transcriptional regulator YdaS (Cro superfamily)
MDIAQNSPLRAWRESRRMTQTAVATLLGVSKVQVCRWESGSRAITAEQAGAIERATGGQITREELRPDIFRPLSEERAEALRQGIG